MTMADDHDKHMTMSNLLKMTDSDLGCSRLCPACGTLMQTDQLVNKLRCPHCGLGRRLEADHDSTAPQSSPGGPHYKHYIPDVSVIHQLEQSEDPARLLLDTRQSIPAQGILYLAIGPDGRWELPRKALMLLMERCGFRLVHKRDRAAREAWFRRY